MTAMLHDHSADPERDGRNDAWLSMDRGEKVPEIIARRILRAIVDGNYTAGSRLPPEAEMLAKYGIGRASLREALRILEIHGLIRIKPGPKGGPVVTDVSAAAYGQTTTVYLHRMRATFHELIEARLVIEPMMARLAAQRLTPESAERIRAAARRGWEAIDGTTDEWTMVSEEFHQVIGASSENRVLDLYASALVSIERARLGGDFTERSDREQTARTHDRIAGAIISADADKAEERARRHVEALGTLWHDEFARQMGAVIEWR